MHPHFPGSRLLSHIRNFFRDLDLEPGMPYADCEF